MYGLRICLSQIISKFPISGNRAILFSITEKVIIIKQKGADAYVTRVLQKTDSGGDKQRLSNPIKNHL